MPSHDFQHWVGRARRSGAGSCSGPADRRGGAGGRLVCDAIAARSASHLREVLASLAAVGPARDGSTYLDVRGPAGKTAVQVRAAAAAGCVRDGMRRVHVTAV